jgi:Zn-dependent M28 family amino/carboxypeptidase
MEIVRVLGSLVQSGWRPRRTIVFASWAVEEHGLEGSYEYVFENINKIMTR